MAVVLAVIPVQEEERERAHDQEEKDPHPEASIVFDCLVREVNKSDILLTRFLNHSLPKKNFI